MEVHIYGISISLGVRFQAENSSGVVVVVAIKGRYGKYEWLTILFDRREEGFRSLQL